MAWLAAAAAAETVRVSVPAATAPATSPMPTTSPLAPPTLFSDDASLSRLTSSSGGAGRYTREREREKEREREREKEERGLRAPRRKMPTHSSAAAGKIAAASAAATAAAASSASLSTTSTGGGPIAFARIRVPTATEVAIASAKTRAAERVTEKTVREAMEAAGAANVTRKASGDWEGGGRSEVDIFVAADRLAEARSVDVLAKSDLPGPPSYPAPAMSGLGGGEGGEMARRRRERAGRRGSGVGSDVGLATVGMASAGDDWGKMSEGSLGTKVGGSGGVAGLKIDFTRSLIRGAGADRFYRGSLSPSLLAGCPLKTGTLERSGESRLLGRKSKASSPRRPRSVSSSDGDGLSSQNSGEKATPVDDIDALFGTASSDEKKDDVKEDDDEGERNRFCESERRTATAAKPSVENSAFHVAAEQNRGLRHFGAAPRAKEATSPLANTALDHRAKTTDEHVRAWEKATQNNRPPSPTLASQAPLLRPEPFERRIGNAIVPALSIAKDESVDFEGDDDDSRGSEEDDSDLSFSDQLSDDEFVRVESQTAPTINRLYPIRQGEAPLPQSRPPLPPTSRGILDRPAHTIGGSGRISSRKMPLLPAGSSYGRSAAIAGEPGGAHSAGSGGAGGTFSRTISPMANLGRRPAAGDSVKFMQGGSSGKLPLADGPQSMERLVTSDHFSRVGSVGFLGRSESAQAQLHRQISGSLAGPNSGMSPSPSQRLSRNGSMSFWARNESMARIESMRSSRSTLQQHQMQMAMSGSLGTSSVNAADALRVTFISVNSCSNTEMSFDVGGEGMAYGGGGFGDLGYGPPTTNSFNMATSFNMAHSFNMAEAPYFPLAEEAYRPDGAPSVLAEAAGSLYRKGSIDDRWLFGQMVGEGAFSEVRLGESRKGGGRVAIKIINKGAPDLFGEGGVCREALAFQMIGRHQNIVECLEVYEDERYVYIVLELLTGGLLLPRIADAQQYYPQYAERDAAHVIRSMILALVDCHAIGVAHRDVKPENVLFVAEGMDSFLKLADFGMAHCSDKLCTAMCGTPLYVAPEVLLRKPYGCAADLWSVGVIAHILLVGYPPFDDDDLVSLINKVKFAPVRLAGREWEYVTTQAAKFVLGLLTRDPASRLTAPEALRHPWMVATAVEIVNDDGSQPRLELAQKNIQDFVVNREFKRVVTHENAATSFKLDMLVSLSEKNLGAAQAGEREVAHANEDRCALPPELSPPVLSVSASSIGIDSVFDDPAADYKSRLISSQEDLKSPSSPSADTRHRYSKDTGSSSEISAGSTTAMSEAAMDRRLQATLRMRRLDVEENLRRRRVGPEHAQVGHTEPVTYSIMGNAEPSGSNLSPGNSIFRLPDSGNPNVGKNSLDERRVADADSDLLRWRAREKEPKKATRSPKKSRLRWPKVHRAKEQASPDTSFAS